MNKEIEVKGNEVIFTKNLWRPDQIDLALSLDFSFSQEKSQVTAYIPGTTRKAMFEFLQFCFPSVMQHESNSNFKRYIFDQLKEKYATNYNEFLTDLLPNLQYQDKLYAHQKEALFVGAHKKNVFYAMDQGLGKCQSLDCKVFTPKGYVMMGDISIGDKVIGRDGKAHPVTGVYPQGLKEVFKVKFSDGTSTECCDDHLWFIQTQSRAHLGYDFYIKPLRDFRHSLTKIGKGLRYKYFIPTTKPVEFNVSPVPLDPYLMGLLLGDGCFRRTISYSTDDQDLIPVIGKLLPFPVRIMKHSDDNYCYRLSVPGKSGHKNPLTEIIRSLGLFDKLSHEKFIPENFLINSIENRIAILQGLFDSDGSVSKEHGRLSFSTMSTMMAEGFQFLIQSLGGICKTAKCIRKGKRDCYTLTFWLPENIIPCRLKRRIALLTNKERNLKRKIVSVESIGLKKCQCISVDSDDNSYLTDSFIVTHNTLTGASRSKIFKIRTTVIVCPSIVKWNWFRELTAEAWGFNPLYFTILDAAKSKNVKAFQERFVIVNYESLGKFMEYLLRLDCGHIILDEAQKTKNVNTQIFKNVAKLRTMHPNALLTFLSGTPIKNRCDDLFAYLKLSGHHLGKSHTEFLKRYTYVESGRGGDKVAGGRNREELHLMLSNFMFRKTKEECLDLPDKVITKYYFQMDDYRDEYNKILEEIATNPDSKGLNSSLHTLNILVTKSKIPGIMQLIDDLIEQDKKVVVFSSYKDPLNQMEAHYGDSCVKIDGSVPSHERDRRIEKFKNNPDCKIFFGNMIAAGVGITLTCSSDVIFMNFPFTPSDLAQATDRLHRIGAKNNVNVYYTICEKSIDENLFRIVTDKSRDINEIIDKGKPGVTVYEDIPGALFKELIGRQSDGNTQASE